MNRELDLPMPRPTPPSNHCVTVMAEIADGIRCAICEEPFAVGSVSIPIGTHGEFVHETCAETEIEQ